MKNIKTYGPNANSIYPMEGVKSLCFIKNIVKNPNIIVGDYTYYDDFSDPKEFEKNVLYHYEFLGDKLVIGKFCAIASDVKFIMNGANHKIKAFTTYPFGIFGNGWESGMPKIEELPFKGDTMIGNDVWIGMNSTIMPGIKVGDGAIIATKAVVTRDVPPYTIVGGNPAKIIRKRFTDEIIEVLLKIKWWNWEIEKITENISILCSEDIDKLIDLI
ncbi:Vat family streptogramin A O-acetyltransferase [Tepidibacter mesophilus]|uniref:Vat family streptogramin A O-acetyltransferase n=1 Tax=Tepidibacter mesophilus TaxID=655607 RepID=UPI000C06F352|nr:Vat family streptogramin A O-acetyltransferase [Tepidibacter mesophilus]